MSGVLIQISVFVIVWWLAGLPWALTAILGVLSIRLALRIFGLQHENDDLRQRLDEAEAPGEELQSGPGTSGAIGPAEETEPASAFRAPDTPEDAEPASGFRPRDTTVSNRLAEGSR